MIAPFDHRKHIGADNADPEIFDRLGEHQLQHLKNLGLQPHHYLIDVGCGCLRAGRWLMPYLEAGHYYGLEPVREALQGGIDEVPELVDKHNPQFFFFDQFELGHCGRKFDFQLWYSIITHTGCDLIQRAFRGVKKGLAADGKAAILIKPSDNAFYVPPETGWIYPGVLMVGLKTISSMAQAEGLDCSDPLDSHYDHFKWVTLTHIKGQTGNGKSNL